MKNEMNRFIDQLILVLTQLQQKVDIPYVESITSVSVSSYILKTYFNELTNYIFILPNLCVSNPSVHVLIQNSDHVWFVKEFEEIEDVIEFIEEVNSKPIYEQLNEVQKNQLYEDVIECTFEELRILAKVFQRSLT